MPYGAIATQSVLESRAPDDGTVNSYHQCSAGFVSSDALHAEGRGVAAAAPDTFAGVMRALLKPSPSPPASPGSVAASTLSATPVPAPADEEEEAPKKPVWQPRSALDFSGHSFRESLRAEIRRCKQQAQDARTAEKLSGMHASAVSGVSSMGGPTNLWWAKKGGRDLDDLTLSRVSSTSTLPPSPMLEQRMPAAPPGSRAMVNPKQHEQPGSAYRSRGYDGDFSMSLVVGLQ